MEKTNSTVSQWVIFIAIILILMGVYGSIRTAINLIFFEKYPQSGVLTLNFSGIPLYPQREEDCDLSLMTYDDVSRENLQPADIKERERQSCLKGVVEARENAKINDISQSSLLLFLGIGLLISKKIFKL